MAPIALAEPAAANPATPPPMIRTYSHTHEAVWDGDLACLKTDVPTLLYVCVIQTFAGGTFPAAVICPVKKRPKLLAASTTALYLKWQENNTGNDREAENSINMDMFKH